MLGLSLQLYVMFMSSVYHSSLIPGCQITLCMWLHMSSEVGEKCDLASGFRTCPALTAPGAYKAISSSPTCHMGTGVMAAPLPAQHPVAGSLGSHLGVLTVACPHYLVSHFPFLNSCLMRSCLPDTWRGCRRTHGL